MKKISGIISIVVIIIFLMPATCLFSQTLSPKVTPSKGGYATGGGNSLSWTMGETFNTTLSTGNIILSQGQQQPEMGIVATNVSASSLCTGSTFNVQYTASGYYGAANTFTVQLSNATGSFVTPINIGSISSSVSGNISCTVPVSTTIGSNYRVRVISNHPSYTGKASIAMFSISSCSCTGFRTYGKGAWKANAHGNNAGTYLKNNFASAFPGPDYLTIGCTNKVRLTTWQAVKAYLPVSGSPGLLPIGIQVNPTSTNNSFSGQLVALTLNIRFDDWDPNFSSSSTHLKALIVASGTFMGWTVQQVFDEANKKIGGCVSSYTLSQLTTVLDLINNNYTNGTINNGFLNCPPTTRFENPGALVDNIFVYPNPANELITIRFISNSETNVALRLVNLTGQILLSEDIKAVEGTNLHEIDLSTFTPGIYLIQLVSENRNDVIKIVIDR